MFLPCSLHVPCIFPPSAPPSTAPPPTSLRRPLPETLRLHRELCQAHSMGKKCRNRQTLQSSVRTLGRCLLPAGGAGCRSTSAYHHRGFVLGVLVQCGPLHVMGCRQVGQIGPAGESWKARQRRFHVGIRQSPVTDETGPAPFPHQPGPAGSACETASADFPALEAPCDSVLLRHQARR